MQAEGWSGSPQQFVNGTAEFLVAPELLNDSSLGSFVTRKAENGRAGEVSLKSLSPQERTLFDAADAKEWEGILASGAVRVIAPAAAA
eukprot:8877248-Alexandrium_andersonii.AAC.1